MLTNEAHRNHYLAALGAPFRYISPIVAIIDDAHDLVICLQMLRNDDDCVIIRSAVAVPLLAAQLNESIYHMTHKYKSLKSRRRLACRTQNQYGCSC